MNKQRLWVLIIAGVGALATFLPWVTMGMLSVPGTAGDGWISFGFFTVAAILAAAGDRTVSTGNAARNGIAVMGALATCLGVSKIITVSDIGNHAADNAFAKALASAVSPGIGVFLCLGAGVAMAASAFRLQSGVPKPAPVALPTA